MTNEQYIEHEVKLRLHEEMFKLSDKKNVDKFTSIDKRFDKMDSKLNWIIGIVLGWVIAGLAPDYFMKARAWIIKHLKECS